MPKNSNVWKYFTRLTDANGKDLHQATCNNCVDNKKHNTKGGTTNLWRHFVKDFTHNVPDDLGDERGTVQCNICQSKFKSSALTFRQLVEHVMACKEQQDGTAVGSSSMDLDPADLGAQQPPPPPLPSDPPYISQSKLKESDGTTSQLKAIERILLSEDNLERAEQLDAQAQLSSDRPYTSQSKLKESGGITSQVEHVVASIQQPNAAAAETSRPLPMQTPALPGFDLSSMDDLGRAESRAQPPLPMQTPASTGSGSSSTDLLPAYRGAQLPLPPSAPSRPAGSSSDGEPAGMDEPSKHLARMIALRGYDPSIVDDDCFRSFLGSLNPEFTMPSRVKIEEECDRIFDEARRDLLSRLSSSRGRVSLAVGGTKIFDKDFIYITCHFIDDEWILRKLVIDAFMVVDDENLENGSILGVQVIGHAFEDDDDDYYSKIDMILNHISCHGISNRLFMVTYETNNQKFSIRLKDRITERFSDTNTRTREILCTTYVDKMLYTIAQCFLFEEDVSKIDVARDVEQLDLTRGGRQLLISHLGLDDPWMYHDENWYAMYCSLKVLGMKSSNATDTNSFGELLSLVCGRKHNNMQKYGFMSKLLCGVWEKIHHAIQRISASSCPTSHLCLEILLKIQINMQKHLQLELKHLTNETDRDIVDIEDAIYILKKTREILDKAIRDSYLIWSIPLALDPRYKLGSIRSIFEEAFESDVGLATRYISNVTKRIMELYADYRKDEDGTSTGAGHSDSGVAVVAGGAEWERYLCDPAPPAKDFDILKWWKGNSQKYPTLARIARDALAMPTCSKPSSDEIAQIKSIVRGYSL